MSTFAIHNVKVHWKCKPSDKIVIPDHGIQHSNFFTVRYCHYVYIVFEKSFHINASGIRDFDDIKGAVQTFNTHFSTSIDWTNISVDNCTASGKLDLTKHNVCIPKILAEKDKHGVQVRVRSHIFPSVIIRQAATSKRSKSRKKGTIILFGNNKFIIVGCKSHASVYDTFHSLCVLTSRLSTTIPQQHAFAQAAEE